MGRKLIHGWNRDDFDERDHTMAPRATAPVVLQDLINLAVTSHEPPIYDQADEGACTGHGNAAIFDFDHHVQLGQFLTPSRQAIYYDERVLEGDTEQDAGAQVRDGLKAMAAGVGPESLWPYEQSNMFTPPDSAYRAAATHKVVSYQSVSQSDYDIGYALQVLSRPIVFGFEVFKAFESDQVAATGVVPLPGRFQSSIGGHCVVIVGRDAKADQYIIRNSWGTDWGQRGYFRMPRKYVLNPKLSSDFWVVTSEGA